MYSVFVSRVGVALVHGYQRIDVELALPSMRSAVEKQLSLIALHRAKFEDVLKHVLVIFALKFRHAHSLELICDAFFIEQLLFCPNV